jgi:hypothetical protein
LPPKKTGVPRKKTGVFGLAIDHNGLIHSENSQKGDKQKQNEGSEGGMAFDFLSTCFISFGIYLGLFVDLLTC